MNLNVSTGFLILVVLLTGLGRGMVTLDKAPKAVGKAQQRKAAQISADKKLIPIQYDFKESVPAKSTTRMLRRMQRRVRRFNRMVATDQFTQHLGKPGTFLDLGGRFPPFKVRSRLCDSPSKVPRRILLIVCRRFKNRHLFWKKQSKEPRTYRKLAAVENFKNSKEFFERKLVEVEAFHSPATPKRRIVASHTPSSKRILSARLHNRRTQLKLVRQFLRKTKRPSRHQMGIPAAPAKHAINFDDSRLIVHMFARESERQPQYVRPENDKEDVVIQPRLQLPN